MRRLAALAALLLFLGAGMARADGGKGLGGGGGDTGGSGDASGSDAGAMSTSTSTMQGRGDGTGEHTGMGVDDRPAGYAGGLPFAGAVDPNVYRLGPGDLLALVLHGQVSRSIPMEVDPEGSVLLPGAGFVRVDTRTLADVRAEILARLRGQFRNVGVDVRLARPRTFRVYLTGQVRNPGAVVVNGTYRVGDILNAAALLPGASRRHIDVLHTDGQRSSCDLELLLQTGDVSGNPWLRDGDIVRVPTATEFVYAQGALARPGRYELGQHDSLLTLCRLAGDPLPAATVDSILLVRFDSHLQPESLWVNLEDVYSHHNNPKIWDGARLYVYFIPRYHQQHEASVLGEVVRPGPYPILEGRTRLSQLVTSAEGFLPTADLTSIRVHRRAVPPAEKDPELDRLLRLSRNELTTSEYEVLNTKLVGLREDYRVDWSRLQKDPSLDVLLRDGDVVQVERLVLSIRVDGQVRRPGILNFVPGSDVDSYVNAAGGFTNRAWSGKVRVTRAVTGQTLLARNVRTLDPGDFVWVPERPDVTTWEQAGKVLTSLAEVATILIAIRSLR